MIKIIPLTNGIEIDGTSFPFNSLSFSIKNAPLVEIRLASSNKKILSSSYTNFVNQNNQLYSTQQAVLDDLLLNNSNSSSSGSTSEWTLYEIQQADITPTSGAFTIAPVSCYCMYKIVGNIVYLKVQLIGTAASTLNAIQVQLPLAINVSTNGGIFVDSGAVLVVAGTYQPTEIGVSGSVLSIARITGNFPDADLYIYYNDFNEQVV